MKNNKSSIKYKKKPNEYEAPKYFKSFGIYIRRILKNINKDRTISKNGIVFIDYLIAYYYELVMNKAKENLKNNKKKTLSIEDIRYGITNVISEDLSDHSYSYAFPLNKVN